MVREGKFRDDLYFRLNVVRITMPPLRARKEDIPLLVRSFLRHFSRANEKPLLDLTTDAMNTLLAYDWPGNVRELRTAIEHGVVMTSGPKVTVRDLPRAIRESAGNASGASTVAEKVNPLDLAETEKRLITQALASTGGNITAAANQLGISRRTLHRKLNEMNAQGRNVREQARAAKKRTE
jgi:Transcriptional regulator containing PAS, AAA-type ATPase, and DNA-binding domains